MALDVVAQKEKREKFSRQEDILLVVYSNSIRLDVVVLPLICQNE